MSIHTGAILLWIIRCSLLVGLVTILYFATVNEAPVGVFSISDKLNHLLAFFVLALLLDLSFPLADFSVGKLALLIGYGLLIEMIQFFLPYREFSLLDLGGDCLGVAIYIVVYRSIGWGEDLKANLRRSYSITRVK